MRSTLIALTLTASLAAGRPAFLDQLWSLLTSVWSASSLDEGCRMDPNGGRTSVPQADAGCIMDPSGACKPGS